MQSNTKEISWNITSLWKGCMLASIAHAIMVTEYPSLAHEHSWDGFNYNVQDTQGGKGTISFGNGICFGAFFSVHSEPLSDLSNSLSDIPSNILSLAQTEALQYMLEEIDNEVRPVITSFFWGVNDKVFTKDNDIFKNGGFLLDNQLMNVDESIEAWKEYYDMSDEQCLLLKSLYNKKLQKNNEIILLTEDEVNFLSQDEPEGLEECQESFLEIGFKWFDK